MAKVFPAAKAMVAVIHNNRAMWKKMNIHVKKMTIVSGITMDSLLSSDVEDDDPGTVDSGTST